MFLMGLLALSSVLLPIVWAARPQKITAVLATPHSTAAIRNALQVDGFVEFDSRGQAPASTKTNVTNQCLYRRNINEVLITSKTLVDQNRTCSIVGSGGSLVGKREGFAIDEHDFVIRMNEHPTRGFEQDVGTKTTLRLFYPESSGMLRPGAEIPKFAIMVPYKDFDMHWYSCIQKQNLRDLGPVCSCAYTHKPKDDTWKPSVACNGLLEFSNLGIVTKLFQEQQKACYASAGLKKRPSEGFTALILALAICDQVDLYGFGPSSEGQCRYDSPGRCETVPHIQVHDIAGEHEFYAKLAKAGIIDIKTTLSWITEARIIGWRHVRWIAGMVVGGVVIVVVLYRKWK